MPRVLLIGLDCAAPRLVFDLYRHALPNLSGLMAAGCWGPLRSCAPPITVPAWACMLSGRDPGELGLYGFRKRNAGSYALTIASSEDPAEPLIWQTLGAAGKRVCVLFVPPTYPPPEVNGQLVSCFLTPDADHPHTFPPELAAELSARFGAYEPDVEEYRTDDLPGLRAALYRQSEQRFAIAEHLLRSRAPDFTALVDIGLDRFHHAFWSHIDPDDPRHEPRGAWAGEGLAYYAFLDAQVGRLLAAAGGDTSVLVVSDHGAQPLLGGICINEWLIERGYLVLRERPPQPTPLAKLDVDWSRTRAYAEGGYYARVCLNVRGREPQGVVTPSEVPQLRATLARELAALRGPRGEVLSQRVVVPEEAYRATRGLPPELMVFFDDLRYRALGTVGHGSIYSRDNDQGPDGCNHAWDGMFILAGAGVSARGRLDDLQIYDVSATIRALFGLSNQGLLGRDRSGGAQA